MSLTHPRYPLNGILLIDKPSGLTSHDVVEAVRRKLRMRKVGHGGTLDPMATGLLAILVGEATAYSPIFTNHDKAYAGTFLLGSRTDSADCDGRLIETRPVEGVTEARVREVFKAFLGSIEQIPPMISAKRYQGKRLYDLARQGVVVARGPHRITIFELDLLALRGAEVDFRVHCSKGTYIRTLCEDIGEKLGCGAYLAKLRRTHSGRYSMEQGIPLAQLDAMSLEDIRSRLITRLA